ncbi:hypothetical protein CMV_010350 [Castanea mollissima]|uniref:Uncharacterized protein n=1 Tax=Castanea mollissima TaxID=60419 RepID=A0A8J4RN18_9ROSI|nr:hypothetical protein CMV_010350 [Castanea mollissima]
MKLDLLLVKRQILGTNPSLSRNSTTRKLLLMRNGDFKELGVWSCQIKEPKRYSYMVDMKGLGWNTRS